MRFFLFILSLSFLAHAQRDLCEFCGNQRGKDLYQHVFNENLDDSDYTGANLNQVLFLAPSKSFSSQNVKYDYADMQKARFSRPGDGELFAGSSWRGVDLRYAFLKEAKFLDAVDVGIALIDDNTELPKGLRP